MNIFSYVEYRFPASILRQISVSYRMWHYRLACFYPSMIGTIFPTALRNFHACIQRVRETGKHYESLSSDLDACFPVLISLGVGCSTSLHAHFNFAYTVNYISDCVCSYIIQKVEILSIPSGQLLSRSRNAVFCSQR